MAARRIRENALAGAEGYAEIMEGVREAVKLEAERCIRVWGSGGRGAEILLQCKLAHTATTKRDSKVAIPEDVVSSRKMNIYTSKISK